MTLPSRTSHWKVIEKGLSINVLAKFSHLTVNLVVFFKIKSVVV